MIACLIRSLRWLPVSLGYVERVVKLATTIVSYGVVVCPAALRTCLWVFRRGVSPTRRRTGYWLTTWEMSRAECDMCAQAIANPDDLDRFARELKQFNEQLAGSMARLQGQFAGLSETWRDQEHYKFAQEFEQTMRVLHQFMRTSDVHIPFLQRKAARIRDYLNQR